METKLKNFFLTVANYPLPEKIEKYLEYLNGIPTTSSHYHYISLISEVLECKDGRTELAKAMSYKRHALFTDEDLKVFEKQKAGLVKILDQIVSGQSLEKIRGLWEITIPANALQPKKTFEIGRKGKESVLFCRESYPEMPEGAFSKKTGGGIGLDDTVLNEVFNLACYSLSVLLADGGRDRIKRCAQCNDFFSRDRNDERNRFCPEKGCQKISSQVQRKTDDGKAQRAAYMRGYNADKSERKRARERARELKRLMDSGHTRKEAEEWLNDDEA